MSRILLSRYFKNVYNAGPKAKIDIEKILNNKFDFKVRTIYESSNVKGFEKIVLLIKSVFLSILTCKNDFVCFQYPYSGRAMKINRSKSICLVHDINGLRYCRDTEFRNDIKNINYCNYIIVHNSSMKKILVENGIDPKNIFILELFDYLAQGKINKKYEFDKNNISLIYPGNLSKEKSPFIYQLEEKKMRFKINLYGKGYDTNNKNKKMKYCGTFEPDCINELEGDIGLIWDGNFDERDESIGFKNYTKYNNPHKVSCCLAVGIPVIVWSKSAISEFVKKENIGYTIDNIYDINKIDFSDYDVKRKNSIKIGERVREGYYTEKVFKSIIK